MKVKLLFLIFYILVNVISFNNAEKANKMDYNMDIYKEYVQIDNHLKEFANTGVKLLLPYLMEASEHVNISAICTRNLFQLLSGFRKLTDWSVKFLDATGKLPSGILTGNFHMLGEYDQCLDITVMKGNGKLDFRGQYCSVKYSPHLPSLERVPSFYSKIDGLANATRNVSDSMKFFLSRLHLLYTGSLRLGACVPSGCNQQDITNIMNYAFEQIYMNATVEYCLKEGDVYFWTNTRLVVTCVFVLLGLLTISSTLLEIYLSKSTSKNVGIATRILACFSLRRNFPLLMNTESSEVSLVCFNGIRTLGLFWVILVHEYVVHGLFMRANHAIYFEKMISRFFAQIILNGSMVVDIFFFMSGFLNSYIRMKLKKNGEEYPVVKLIIHRLWRIYPSLIVGHLIFLLFDKPGSFSYAILKDITEKCEHYWWRNFLFINNLFPFKDMCLEQTWFISVDMQLFLLSLFTVPVLFRYPRKGVILNLCMIFVGCFASVVWWWTKHLPPHIDFTLITRSQVYESFHAYVLPFQHTGPYFFGILMGYMISTYKEIQISKIQQATGGLISSFFFISMLFITMRWNSGISYTSLESILYGAFSKTIFALGFSWLVLCCVTGHGGVVNYILSLKLWYPISKLTYMLYLVSLTIQIFYHANLRFPFEASNMTIIWSYFGNLSVSLLISLALVVIVESPVIALEKLIFPRKKAVIQPPPRILNKIDHSMKSLNGFKNNERPIVTHM